MDPASINDTYRRDEIVFQLRGISARDVAVAVHQDALDRQRITLFKKTT